MSNEYKDWTVENYKEEITNLTQQRDELLAAAENLIRVKGRYHTEKAYKALEATIAKVKEQK